MRTQQSSFLGRAWQRTGYHILQSLCAVFCLSFATLAQADDCGAVGQRACRVDERIPSCDLNLVEGGGRCVRPQCGAEGQRGCGPTERVKFDLVLRAFVPQVCDENLKYDLARNLCFHPSCGREGQAACIVLDRIPSCDLNLVEQSAKCFHPPLCGRLGQPLCDLLLRGPLRQCDANLVVRLGQCQHAGSPDSGGGAGSGTHAAAPVSSSSSAPPPPPGGNVHAANPLAPSSNVPPPRPPGNGNVQPAVPAATSATTPPLPAGGAPGVPPPPGGGVEVDTDRVGHDIYRFPMSRPDPATCRATCIAHAECVAWTFVKPGLNVSQPLCYLKNLVPPPTRNSCCVSGVK